MPFWHKFSILAFPYFKSSAERWSARLLLLVIISLSLASVYIQVQFNHWYNAFYNALQLYDVKAFFHQLRLFCLLAAAFIALAVYQYYLTQMLQIRWRRWLTDYYLEQWLAKHAYYRMQVLDKHSTDNPDQRISEDINQFTGLTLSLSLGLLSAVVTLCSFVFILWKLSGVLNLSLSHWGNVAIHGYMVYAAILYALLGTGLTVWVGKPLVELNYNQQRFEADFRFSMVRLRENSESVAFYRGEEEEKLSFKQRFQALFVNYIRIMKQQKKLIFLNAGYNQLAIIFPVLVAAPRYLAKKIQLGGLIQTMTAFGHVHDALSYIANSFSSFAEWKAVVNRLIRFTDTIQDVTHNIKAQGIDKREIPEKNLEVENLSIALPDGKILLSAINLKLYPGESLLISGSSGVGKSTLLRALAGIWPFCTGVLRLPQTVKILFLPQRAYLPLGTLREILNYPNKLNLKDTDFSEVLKITGLSPLIPILEEKDNWSQTLSIGEQQRIAFARVILQKPDIIFLDEATASLDEKAEAELYEILKSKLPQAIIVSVGHRSTLKKWHTKLLNLV